MVFAIQNFPLGRFCIFICAVVCFGMVQAGCEIGAGIFLGMVQAGGEIGAEIFWDGAGCTVLRRRCCDPLAPAT